MYNSPVKIEILRAFSYYGTKYSTTDSDSNLFGCGFPVGYWIRNIDSQSLNDIIIPQYQYNEKLKLFIGIEKTTNLPPMKTLIIPVRYLMLLLFEGKIEIANGRFDQVFDVRFNSTIADYEVNAWAFHPHLSELDSITFYRDIGAMPEEVIEKKETDETYKYEREPSVRKYEKIVDPKYFSLFGNFNNCEITKLPKELKNQLPKVSNSTLFLNSILPLKNSTKKEEPRKTMYQYYIDIGTLGNCKFNIAKVGSKVNYYYMSHTFGRGKGYDEFLELLHNNYQKVRNKFDSFVFDGEAYYTLFPISTSETSANTNDIKVLRNYYDDQEYLRNYEKVVGEFKQKLEFKFLERYIEEDAGFRIVFKSSIEDDIRTDNTFSGRRTLEFYKFNGKSIILPNYEGTLILGYYDFINYNIEEIDVPKGSIELDLSTTGGFVFPKDKIMKIKKLRASNFKLDINNMKRTNDDSKEIDIDKQSNPFKVIIDEMILTHSDRFISEIYYNIPRVHLERCYNTICSIKKFVLEEKENLVPIKNNARWSETYGYFIFETIDGMGELIGGSGLLKGVTQKRAIFADSNQIKKGINLLTGKTYYVLGRNRFRQATLKKWAESSGCTLTNKVENADYVICEDKDLLYKYVTSKSLTPKVISSTYLRYLNIKSLGGVEF